MDIKSISQFVACIEFVKGNMIVDEFLFSQDIWRELEL